MTQKACLGAETVLSSEGFVRAALAIVDEHGLEGLTLKKLGDRLEVSHTAVYRYFDNISAVAVAVRTHILESMQLGSFLGLSPRDRIVAVGLLFRETISRHPNIAPVFMNSPGDEVAQLPSMTTIVDDLRRLGLRGRQLTIAYQALESYVLGATLWEFASSPNHVRSRLAKMRMVRQREFDHISRDEEEVARHSAEAFRTGLESLVDALIVGSKE